MRIALLPLALLFAAVPAWAGSDPAPAALQPAPEPPAAIARELKSGDGKTMQTAYVVFEKTEGRGIRKQYQILQYLGLERVMQSLVFDDKTGKPYDLMRVRDSRTGEERDVWFDISGYFGKF